MATYAGVTFSPAIQGSPMRAHWTQEPNMQVRHIPYAGYDDVQSAGLGNPQITLPVRISDDSGVDTLIAAQGSTARDLDSFFGQNYSNVRLLRVANPRRAPFDAEWIVDLTFMREGS